MVLSLYTKRAKYCEVHLEVVYNLHSNSPPLCYSCVVNKLMNCINCSLSLAKSPLIILLAFIVLSPQTCASKQGRILIYPQKKKGFLAGVSLFMDFRLTRYPSALPYRPKVGTSTFFVHGRLHIVNKQHNPIIFLIDSLLKFT
jgi:hypothetical protein